jgi:hypothetical protein
MRTSHPTLKLAVAGVVALGAGALLAPSAQALLASQATTSGLTDATVVALYEEERLAGDVYEQLADDTGAQIFSNIAESEDRHKAAVATLLDARGIEIDALPSAAGTYQTDGYDELYDRYVSEGQQSLPDAYQVGVEIETTDIDDLRALLDQTDDPAEVRVLTALLNGSQNHLAAFESALAGTTGSTGQGPRGNGPGAGPGNGPGRSGQHGMRFQGDRDAVPRATPQHATPPHATGPHSSTPGECDGSGPDGTGPRGGGYNR